MGAERWRYTDTLESVTARSIPLHLHSTTNPVDVLNSGSLSAGVPAADSEPAYYLYDPTDVSLADLESTVNPESRVTSA